MFYIIKSSVFERSLYVTCLCGCFAFFVSDFIWKLYLFYSILLVLQLLCKDSKEQWCLYITYPLAFYKRILSKMIPFLFFGWIVTFLFIINENIVYQRIIINFFLLNAIVYLFVNYVVPDGYYGATKINPLQVISVLFFYSSIYYPQWFSVYALDSIYYLGLFLISIVMVLTYSRKTIPNCFSKHIALGQIMPGLILMKEVMYPKSCVFSVSFFDFAIARHHKNEVIDQVFVSSIFAFKQVAYIWVLIIVSLVLNVIFITIFFTLFLVVYFTNCFLEMQRLQKRIALKK